MVTAASLLAGLAASSAGYANVSKSVSKDRFGAQEKAVTDLKGVVSNGQGKYETTKTEHATLVTAGESLITYVDTRELWPELFRTINECLPRLSVNQNDIRDPRKLPIFHIRSVTTKKYPDTKAWFDGVNVAYKTNLSEVEKTGPTGPGYVVSLHGTFYYEPDDQTRGYVQFIREALLKNFEKDFHKADGSESGPVPVRNLGISHALIGHRDRRQVLWFEGGPPKGGVAGNAGGPMGLPAPSPLPEVPTLPGKGDAAKPANQQITINEYVFELQFVWRPTPAQKRLAPVAVVPVVDPNAAPPIGGESASVVPGAPGSVTMPPGSVVPQPGINPTGPATNPAPPSSNPVPGTLPGNQAPTGVTPQPTGIPAGQKPVVPPPIQPALGM